MVEAKTREVRWSELLEAEEPLQAYWAHPSAGVELRAFGICQVLQAEDVGELAACLEPAMRTGGIDWRSGPRPPGPWIGAVAFDLEASSRNGPFPAARFVLPERLSWRRGDRSYETSFRGGPNVAGLRRSPGVLSPPLTRAGWDVLMASALAQIQAARLQKVVLARAVDRPPVVRLPALLRRLRDSNPTSRTFMVRGSDGTGFVGSTPERLASVAGRELVTEALAGTTARGAGGAPGARDKETREHAWVVEGILRALAPLAERVDAASAPERVELRHLVHLRTPIRATLRGGVSVTQVLAAMHPTAAVGGWPRGEALAFLRESEGLERGWYGGAVGLLGEGGAELVVGIRSAALHADRTRLFVGAGVVAGSVAAAEWDETELKSRTLAEALVAHALEVDRGG